MQIPKKSQIFAHRYSNVNREKYEKCLKHFQKNVDIPILILDRKYLQKLQNEKCEKVRKIEIAVELKYSKNRKILQDSRFKIIFFENSTTKDFLTLKTEPSKIIPKNFEVYHFGNLMVPKDIPMFLGFLRRSKFLECRNMQISREDQERYLDAQKSVDILAELRDLLLEFGMFSFLNGGTFLGWYRECNIIPHTTDMDISIFIEDLNPKIIDYFNSRDSKLILATKYGRINDSLEFSVYPTSGYQVKTDIFFMYSDFENGTNMNWIGGMSPKGEKIRFYYPNYDPWCAAELLGHIFWVTCTPEYHVKLEYGENWFKDHHSSEYRWKSSGNNAKNVGKWKSDEMKDVRYMFYKAGIIDSNGKFEDYRRKGQNDLENLEDFGLVFSMMFFV
ncbi:unnamed protein product [Caenorhabditis angaria]|uniref:W02B3.4-like N-terminal domain-containing protein n=1 Tax=Caenorhabditis angaria TaxID=860376 RepID=A0A9P1IF69_9PELO|nr:unnamed protein product [Caenorhabditis angaria]